MCLVHNDVKQVEIETEMLTINLNVTTPTIPGQPVKKMENVSYNMICVMTDRALPDWQTVA